MAADVQILFDEGKCYECFGPLTQVQILRLTLLARIATTLDPMAQVGPQALIDRGSCLACLGMSIADIMELVLLDMINVSASGGGGGGSSNLSGSGSPVGVVAPDSTNQIYFNTATNPWEEYVSTGLTSADWHQVL